MPYPHRIASTRLSGLAICMRCRQVDPEDVLRAGLCSADLDETDLYRIHAREEQKIIRTWIMFVILLVVVGLLCIALAPIRG